MNSDFLHPSVPPDKSKAKNSLINSNLPPSQLLNAEDKQKILERVDWWSDDDDADTNTLKLQNQSLMEVENSNNAGCEKEINTVRSEHLPNIKNCIIIGNAGRMMASNVEASSSNSDNVFGTENVLKRLLAHDMDAYTNILARKRRQASSGGLAKKVAISSTNNTNRFAILGDGIIDEDDDVGNVSINQSNTSRKNTNNGVPSTSHNISEGSSNLMGSDIKNSKCSSGTAMSNNTGNNNFNSRENWCPPIFTKGITSKTIVEFFKSANLNLDSVKFDSRGFGRLKIFVKEVGLHSLLLNEFKASNVDSFSFTPKEMKKFNIILKGIPGNFSPSIVNSELLKLDPSLKVTVKKFETKWSKDNDIPLDLFLCVLDDRESLTKIKNLKFLMRHRIRWDTVKNSGTKQCYRCQRFGHVSAFCTYAIRCVKCLKEHQPGSCDLGPKTDTSTASCVNCGNSGHPASYKGCPKRLELLQNKELANKSKNNKKEMLNDSVFNLVNNVPKNGISFADALRGSSAPATISPSKPEGGNVLTDFMNESKKLFGISFSALFAKIRDFWPYYTKLNDFQKPEAYLAFIASFSNPSP